MDKQTRITINGQVSLTGADQVRQQADAVRKSQEAVASAASEAGEAVEDSMTASQRATHLLNEEVKKLPGLLRDAFQALKSGDLKKASGLEEQAARIALKTGDAERLQVTNSLRNAVYAKNDKQSDLGAQSRFNSQVKKLEDYFAEQGDGVKPGNVNSATRAAEATMSRLKASFEA